MDRIRAGDHEALGALLREAWKPLVRHLGSLLESTAAAEDAAQEAFVRLWERRDRWKRGSARALLFRIGRNVALDERRKAEVRRRWAWERIREPKSSPPSPEDELHSTEFARRFREALESVPARRREVFEMVRLGGLSYADVAEALEVSPQTVANQMSLAMKDLRRLLSDFLTDASPAPASRDLERSSDG